VGAKTKTQECGGYQEMVSYVDNNVKIIGSISAVWGQRPKLKNVVDIKPT